MRSRHRTIELYLNILKQLSFLTSIRKVIQAKDLVRKVQPDKLLSCANKKSKTDFHLVEMARTIPELL